MSYDGTCQFRLEDSSVGVVHSGVGGRRGSSEADLFTSSLTVVLSVALSLRAVSDLRQPGRNSVSQCVYNVSLTYCDLTLSRTGIPDPYFSKSRNASLFTECRKTSQVLCLYATLSPFPFLPSILKGTIYRCALLCDSVQQVYWVRALLTLH